MTTADDIYALLEHSTTPSGEGMIEAHYKLLEWIDNLCLAGKFSEAEAALLGMDLERLDTNLAVGVLTNAYACALPCFDTLLPKVRERLTTLVPDRVDKILQGLTLDAAIQRRKEFGR